MRTNFSRRMRQVLVYVIVNAQIFAGQVYAATGTEIASEPLSQPASNIPPNIMLLYDDSGSMAHQITPDYLTRYSSYDGNALCPDTLDSSANITGSLRNCEAGDVLLMSPDINTQYYNPDIRYQPAVNYDGSEKASMTCANTGGTMSGIYCLGGWTAVPTDNVTTSGTNLFRVGTINMLEPGETTTYLANQNLVTGYLDRVWCSSQGATTTDTTVCKQNSAWTYPDSTFGYGWSSGSSGKSNVKRVTGAPYYYRLATTEYCSDAALTNCIAATSPTTVGSTSYIYAGKVRYCTDSTLTDCRAKYSSTYDYPKYIGNVNSGSAAIAAVAASGTITVGTQNDSQAGTITAINVNGVNIISGSGTCGSISVPAGSTTAAIATLIEDRIDTCTSSPDYTASRSGSVVTVTSVATGTTPNGYSLAVVSNTTGTSGTQITITFSSTSDATSSSTGHSSIPYVSSATLTGMPTSPNPFNLISATVYCTTATSPACSSNTQSTRNSNMAERFYNAMALPSGWSKSRSNAVITLTSPSGSNYNSVGVSINDTRTTTSTSNLGTGGQGVGDVQTTTSGSLSGGANAVAAITAYRQNIGQFTRTNITNTEYCTTAARTTCVAATASHPNATHPFSKTTFTKASGRNDCADSYCTYEEEMTNFSNWFAYYRSRAQMAKTAIGRAFVGLGTQYRIGFVTIAPFDSAPNTTTSVYSSRYLSIDSFSTTQKDSWFDKLYGISRNGVGTPNRTALARVGMYYADANPNSMGSSPMTYSCQSNYTVLVTDGYWNDTVVPWKIDGSSIGNQDFNLTVTPRPQFDGSSTATVTTETVADTHTLGNLGGNSCSASTRKVIRSRLTTTRVVTYTAGNLTSDVTTPVTVDTAIGSCLAAPTLPADTSTTTTTTSTSGGSSNSLSDVAAYYYNTDLRPTLADEVPIVGNDTASHQHMTTFTVGLGLAGTLTYDPNYLTQTSGDYRSITQGSLNWPVPASNAESTLDDTWHAAVNGHGQFFSAQNPSELSQSITDTLNSVASRVGAGAAAATSNLQPVAGDNFAFTAQYQTQVWTGDLSARTIDLSDGTVSSVALWSAATQLDQRTDRNRSIYTFDSADTTAGSGANGNKLRSFCWTGAPVADYPTCNDGAGLTAAEMAYFNPTGLDQYLGWGSDGSGRTGSVTAEKLVDYLRGDISNEISGLLPASTSDLFRNRQSLLGDIISAQPAYVKVPPFSYSDDYYSDFKSDNAARRGTVYVAANDGMLHAFETDPDNNPYYQDAGISTIATTDDHFTGSKDTSPITGEGAERWAFIPSMVVPNLIRLADKDYSHRYFVDGSPVVGDVCFGHSTSTPCTSKANWRTIIVGGLNAGGRGYYALDITDPLNPKGLWELKGGSDAASCLTDTQANVGTSSTAYSDCNIGLSFGNPIIVKRKSDGKWVVLLTSGYNNFSPGNGKGYLYVVDAQTGAILNRIGTGVGCDGSVTAGDCTSGTVDPSGLGRINAWVDDGSADNTAMRVYGGDLKGNLWRFQLDTSGTGGAVNTVHKVVTLKDKDGNSQPITTKPELALISNYPVVYVSTGKLLGQSDKQGTPTTQSLYAIRDDLSNAAIDLRGGDLVEQGISPVSGTSMRTSTLNTDGTTNAVDFNTDKGWYVDFPDSGERGNVDPQLQLGTLVVPTNVPTTSDCTAGGYGWLNFFDYRSGAFVPGATSNMTSTKITSALVVGINVVQLPGGTVKTIVTTADNQQLSQSTPVSSSAVTGRRVSWRELLVE